MYTTRLTAFIDILGFRGLVSKSNADPSLASIIFDVLMSLHPSNARAEAFGHINEALVPEEELEQVKKDIARAAKNMSKMFDIKFSYFSDSLVISSPAQNEAACFAIIELLAKFFVRVFEEHRLLIRGGIALGNLVHEEGGPIFGQSLVDAYDLESELARHPRILFGPEEAKAARSTKQHQYMLPLILKDESGDYISLGSAYMYIATHSSMADFMRSQLIEGYFASLEAMRGLEAKYRGTKHEEKYAWALSDMLQQQAHMQSL